MAGTSGENPTRRLPAPPLWSGLLDVRLADGSGFDRLLEARELPAQPAFIVVSSFGMPPYVDAALRYGASGFVLKTAPTVDSPESCQRGGCPPPARVVDLRDRVPVSPGGTPPE
jgi:DNA-binding NarL/FixJ family response regulator